MVYVMDSTAMIALLRREPGHKIVRAILEDPNNACYAHAINLCEVFYDFARASGDARAEQAIADLFSINVSERDDLDQPSGMKSANSRPFTGAFRWPIVAHWR